MSVKKPRLLTGLLAIALLAGMGVGVMERNGSLKQRYDALVNALVGQSLPVFSLPDLEGKIHRSDAWQGRVLVLNFWASWCPPCVAEMPMFDELQKGYAQAGVKFVGVAIDDREAVAAFLTENGIDYTILIGNDASMALAKTLGNSNNALPFTAVFDRRGQLVATVVGEVPRTRLDQLLAELTAS